MNARRATVTLLMLVTAVLSTACAKPKVGDACKPNEVACVATTSALTCVLGKYTAVACTGPDGCKTINHTVRCDYRGAPPDATCISNDDERRVCSVDAKSAYSCIDGKVTHDLCDSTGCSPANGTIHCSVVRPSPKPGDKCSSVAQEGNMVCADGAKSFVTCTKGKYELTAMCRGPGGCKPFPELESVACDTKFGVEGDPCLTGLSCTSDGTTLLGCFDNKLVTTRKCRGPKGCDSSRTGDECDESVAEIGDTCAAGMKACSMDGKFLLECKAGAAAFSVAKACTNGCGTNGGKSGCK